MFLYYGYFYIALDQSKINFKILLGQKGLTSKAADGQSAQQVDVEDDGDYSERGIDVPQSTLLMNNKTLFKKEKKRSKKEHYIIDIAPLEHRATDTHPEV